MDLVRRVLLPFSEFLSTTSALSGITEIDLKRAIRPIHQRHATSEYSWLLDELDELNQKVPTGVTVAEFFDPALHAQNRARKEATQLYPGVRDTLTRLRAGGTTVVAYTESLAFWTRWRIQQTGLRPAAVPVLAPVGSRSGWDLLHKARAHWGSANARSNDHDVRVLGATIRRRFQQRVRALSLAEAATIVPWGAIARRFCAGLPGVHDGRVQHPSPSTAHWDTWVESDDDVPREVQRLFREAIRHPAVVAQERQRR